MIIGFGIFLWSLSFLLAGRLAFIGREQGLTPRFRFWLWAAIGIAALALLFRPHEDIFGGEDPGAYVNSGITYGRQQKFFYVDPLLAQIPTEVRSDFYYGHSGYGTTKDACLWVREPERAVIGPHFQPAYPLLIALVSRLAVPAWALYIIPVFTLFLALALRALAALLLPHRLAGLIAFLVFLLNPLTLWHGRCLRPEIIAGFMFFGGCALLLNAWQNRRWSRWPDLVLGAIAIGLAPFFHITAGFLLVPAAVTLAIVAWRGRDDFLIYPLIALAGAVAFVFQMKWVTDYYGVGRFIDPVIFRPALAYGLFAAGFVILAAACRLSRRAMALRGGADPEKSSNNISEERPRRSVALHPEQIPVFHSSWRDALRRVRSFFQPPGSVSLGLSLGFAIVSALFMLVLAFTRDAAGRLPLLGRPVDNYLYMADFKTFANMLSLPIAFLALAGWVAWLTGPVQHRRERIVLGLIVFPAVIFSGNIRDFMMTRYWFIALIPMAVLCLTALATLLTNRSAWLAVSGAAIIILLGTYHRTHLITMTDYQGLTRYLQPYAEIIKQANGILLCEYSRLAAPLEHVFGIPTLGLDNERRDDYSRAEQAWEAIMRKYPDYPAFFMTPFHAPLSDRFDFREQRYGEFAGSKLLQARQGLPTRIAKHELTLKLYRMALKTRAAENALLSCPRAISLDAGNMGLRHFANVRTGDRYAIDGYEVRAGEPFPIFSLAIPQNREVNEVVFLLLSDAEKPSMPDILGLSFSNLAAAVSFQELPNHWQALRIKGSCISAKDSIALLSATPMWLADVIIVSDGNAWSIMPQLSKPKMVVINLPPMTARWARQEASVLLPAPAGKSGLLLMLIEPPLISFNGLTRLTFRVDSVLPPPPRNVPSGRWQWQAWPYAAATPTNEVGWITLRTEPAWNPGKAGFPDDLGVLVGQVVVLPAREQ